MVFKQSAKTHRMSSSRALAGLSGRTSPASNFQFLLRDRGELVSAVGYGIPAKHQFHLGANFVSTGGLTPSQFLQNFGRLTFSFEHGGRNYKRHFTHDEIASEIRRAEDFLRPKISPSEAGVRRTSQASPEQMTPSRHEAQIITQSALKITFGNDVPYKYGKLRGLHAITRIVCLRVENIGSKTLSECRITIEHVEPKQPFGWPIVLTSGLTLAPGQSERRELVNYGEALDRAKYDCSDSFAMLVLEQDKPFFDVGETIVIRLKATGVDTPACNAQCRIWVDDDGKLQIQDETI